MNSMFQFGFQREAWKPTLGQTTTAAPTETSTDWAGNLSKVLTTGAETYQSYAEKETAESKADAAKATAEATKAAADAAAKAAAAGQEKKIFGVPASYLLYGALGLGLLGVVVVMAKKK